jgi:acyl carrier protein
MAKVLPDQILLDIIEVLTSTNKRLGASDMIITMDTCLAEDLGLDSLRLVTVMAQLEDRYNIEFDVQDVDARNFHLVSDLLNVTLKTLGKGEEP